MGFFPVDAETLNYLHVSAKFYQDLVRQGELTPSGKLPPVLPVVLYNGRERWWAPRQVASLIEQIPGGLSAYQPRLEYLLLDEGEYSEAELASLHNLVAALFRLEQSQDAEAVHKVVDSLVDWLREPGHRGLRRAFSRWLREVLLPARVPDTEIPRIRDLEDARAMLRERVIEWTQEWRQEGRQEGRREGERHLLVQQLEHRFGTLDDSTRSRIERASDERLITWGKRLLSAERLEDVFV